MDPYKTLGINRNASPDDIKRAYRKLASQHHPDKGGNTAKFQEIQQAYEALTNPKPQHQQSHEDWGPFEHSGHFDFDNIFNMFGARFNFRPPPQQARMSMWITLHDVIVCPTRTVNIATEHGTQFVEITIPPGVEDAMNVNYQGIAPGGIDLVVQYRIHPDAKWRRQQHNLYTEVSLSIWKLILGCTLDVTTATGEIAKVTVPPKTQPGTQLRLKGQGLPNRQNQRGDALVKLLAVIPNSISNELEAAIQKEDTK